MNPVYEYDVRLKSFEKEEIRFRRICRTYAWLRLAAFAGILLSIYFVLTSRNPVPFLIAGIALLLLLIVFVYQNTRCNRKQEYFARLVSICKKELLALKFNFESFDTGQEYNDNDHCYSSDLDLFGRASIFQSINRTVTTSGRENLALWLKEIPVESKEIERRQEACRELKDFIDWRLDFMAFASGADQSEETSKLLRWMTQPMIFTRHHRWIIGIRIVQAIDLLLILSIVAGLLNFNILIAIGLVNLSIFLLFQKKINQLSQLFGKTFAVLISYSGLISRLLNPVFSSGWIRTRIDKLRSGDKDAPLQIARLGKLLQRFDNRNNLLVGFFRNAFFLTDLELVIRMEIWRGENAREVEHWFEVLGEMDAMNSLAVFAFNNPSYAFPSIVPDPFSIVARDLGHPLIPTETRVCNNFDLQGWNAMVILTGANMAGKSTFLRTVGINHILAHLGAPVCASNYRFYPTRMITSIRTNDSLIKNESYFYAELKKLKRIIDVLEQGEQVFILLDEVLKGTNSNDKLNGSIILLKKLIQLKTSGMIATHDIALGELEKEFPGNVRNKCFEADIANGQLLFDYKLREGTAKNMTALFLMKQMNIV